MKQKKYFITTWLQKSCILLALCIAFSYTVNGQANFWSTFGNAGCSNNNRMSCNAAVSSSSFTGIVQYYDPTAVSGRPTFFQNSCYDNTGHLLFSVNPDGIYAGDSAGTQFMSFQPGGIGSSTAYFPYYNPLTYTATNIVPAYPVSEICIFPYPGKCNSYYVVFWASDTTKYNFVLRAVEVDINPALYPDVSAYGFTDGIMIDSLLGPIIIGESSVHATPLPFYFCLAADAANSDGSRDVYTLDPAYSSSYGPVSYMRKWTIAADGTLPNHTYTYYDHIDSNQLNAYSPKAKILNIHGTKWFTYISGPTGQYYFDNGLNAGYCLGMYTLPDATTIYDSPPGTNFHPGLPFYNDTGSGIGDSLLIAYISGFEYDSAKDVIYFSYSRANYNADSSYFLPGGLGYFTATGGFDTSSNNTQNYSYTDLELDKYGDLLMVSGEGINNGSPGVLAYISRDSALSTHINPTIITNSCASYDSISILNNNYLGLNGFLLSGSTVIHANYYLTSQLRGENYRTWGYDVVQTDTISATDHWTPSNNPVTRILGGTDSVISFANGIVIMPGDSLIIDSGLTVEFGPGAIVNMFCNGGSATTVGARLYLQNNATLTAYKGVCDANTNLWGGIRVGSAHWLPQLTAATSQQAGVIMSSGATISYAQCGIMLGNWVSSGYSGGGFIQAANANFINNSGSIYFNPHMNFLTYSPGTEANNISSFTLCNFINTDPASWLSPYGICNIYANNIRGVVISGCNFANNTGITTNTNAIEGNDMGMIVSDYNPYYYVSGVGTRCSFSNYQTAIFDHIIAMPDHTMNIHNSQFTNNRISIELYNTVAAIVANNIVSVSATPTPIPPYYTNIKSVGLLLLSSTQFIVNSNSFSAPLSGGHVHPTTVGVLAWNTGSADNLINNNSYENLGTANLANYVNCLEYEGATGLWYACNSNSNNDFDIASLGSDSLLDGIRYNQGYPDGTPGYLNGLPAGNTFSVGRRTWNIYNPYGECSPIVYFYSDTTIGGSRLEQPGNYPNTGRNDSPGVSLSSNSIQTDECNLGNIIIANPALINGSGPIQPLPVPDPNEPQDTVDNILAFNHLAIINNINYYMTDSNGVLHRDSVYYWLGQLNNAYGARTIANMLLEDGNVDSAYKIYSKIYYNYTLTGADSMEFTTYGAQLFNIWDSILSVSVNFKANLIAAYGTSDTIWHEVIPYTFTLDSNVENLVINIFNNSNYWAKIGAENILSLYDPATYNSLITSLPDTLLYPHVRDHYGDDQRTVTPGNTTLASINNPLGLSVYPNPATMTVNFSFPASPTTDIKITDVTGRMMDEQTITNNTTATFDVHNYPKGIYLYQVTMAGNVQTGKLVVE